MGRSSKGAVEAAPEQSEDASAPEVALSAVRVLSVCGFVDEHGDRWHWNANDIVRNPFVISMLLERNAPVEQI